MSSVHLAAGAALVALGFGLRAWAIVYLRRAGIVGDGFYGCATPAHGYATAGPYRLFRHPAYVGTMLVLAGAGVAVFGWDGFVLALPAWPFFMDRAQREERLRRLYEEQSHKKRLASIARRRSAGSC